MSIELIILSGIVAFVAVVGVLRPAILFEYPVAGSLLMWFFIIPQALRIESSGDLNDYEPTNTWVYMILCMICTTVGFIVARAKPRISVAGPMANISNEYDLEKLFHGAVALMTIGGVAVLLVARMAATMEKGEAWTGPIAFYAFIALLFTYGAALAWLLYLYTKQTKSLILAVGGLVATLPTILFYARRELAFIVVIVILLGIFFVRKKVISRIILIPMILIGSVLINKTSDIRSSISTSDTTIVEAIAEASKKEAAESDFSELGSGVSDIAIASWTGQYSFLSPYYNSFVSLYVPAFIVGHDIKDGLKAEVESRAGAQYTEYSRGGATHTGFADSFQSMHYFGCFIFLIIAYFMGNVWNKANSGDIKAQLYYMMLLSVSLKVFTESTSVFFSILPLMFLSLGAVFWYAKRRVPTASRIEAPLVSSARKTLQDFFP